MSFYLKDVLTGRTVFEAHETGVPLNVRVRRSPLPLLFLRIYRF